jgi:hypothetical protein
MLAKSVYAEATFLKAIIVNQNFFFIDKVLAFFGQVVDFGFRQKLTARFDIVFS